MKQAGVRIMLGIWALLCLGGAAYASWQGYGGRAFAATLSSFSLLLLGMLASAAPGAADKVSERFGPASGLLLGVGVFLVYLVYLLGTGTFDIERAGAMAGLVFAPIALALSAKAAAPGTWQDFVIILGVWMLVKFGPSHWLWPYPGGRLAYVLTVLMAVNSALASFLFARRLKGIGYSIGWGRHWAVYVPGSFSVFASIAIPLGIWIHFISFAPQWHRWSEFAGLSLGILFFTAWPEEFLFRGLLQNLLSQSFKNDSAGWLVASALFGFSHITNLGFPNWRYVILATIAGFFYGWIWRKTGSIFASALVHAGVDVTWHFLFKTL